MPAMKCQMITLMTIFSDVPSLPSGDILHMQQNKAHPDCRKHLPAYALFLLLLLHNMDSKASKLAV